MEDGRISPPMNRREFIQYCAALSGQVLLTSTMAKSLSIESAYGEEIPLAKLRQALDPAAAQILIPTDKDFAKWQISFNKRTMLTPTARVMCRTPEAVSAVVQWASDNSVALAMRSGGHSFEGLSQSTGIVIDTRLMDDLSLSPDNQSFTTGAGNRLGAIYDKLSTKGMAVPAGSCPFVGVTGHTMGGGYGLLARPFGLACDSLLEAEVVTADGKIRTASENSDADLFWALRGAGGGSFGLVTKLKYKTSKVRNVFKFAQAYSVKEDTAVKLMGAWQRWAPESPKEMTSIFRTSKKSDGTIDVRVFGISVGSDSTVRSELRNLSNVAKPAKESVIPSTFIDAAHSYYGGDTINDSIYMKGKSDIVKSVMSDSAIRHFYQKLPGGMAAIFDSYGGKIRDKRDTDTAFAHRDGVICSIQYYCQWGGPADTANKLAMMRNFYDSIRPVMFDAAYFNYCDLDLKNYMSAYYGKNAGRLVQIKNIYDPKNIFRHAQSVPLVIS